MSRPVRSSRRRAGFVRMPGAALFLALCWFGCSREADIYDEPEATITPEVPKQEVEIPSVPGLDLTGFPECATRPVGDCVGVNDFPCAFTAHADRVVKDCFQMTECTADDWLSVSLGDDGCLSDIGMQSVDDSLVACLVDALGPIRCPCGQTTYTLFLGVANESCNDATGPSG